MQGDNEEWENVLKNVNRLNKILTKAVNSNILQLLEIQCHIRLNSNEATTIEKWQEKFKNLNDINSTLEKLLEGLQTIITLPTVIRELLFEGAPHRNYEFSQIYPSFKKYNFSSSTWRIVL